MLNVKDKYNNIFQVSINDSRYLSGELVSANKGKIVVKDDNGDHYCVELNDPRYLSGELVSVNKGKKHTEKTLKKMSDAKKGKYTDKNNSQYDTCWVFNDELKQSKKIKTSDLQANIKNGWQKGRKMKFKLYE